MLRNAERCIWPTSVCAISRASLSNSAQATSADWLTKVDPALLAARIPASCATINSAFLTISLKTGSSIWRDTFLDGGQPKARPFITQAVGWSAAILRVDSALGHVQHPATAETITTVAIPRGYSRGIKREKVTLAAEKKDRFRPRAAGAQAARKGQQTARGNPGSRGKALRRERL